MSSEQIRHCQICVVNQLRWLGRRAAQQANITPICINLNCAERIYRTESTSELLYIALHGDYKYTSLKNTSKELDSQHRFLWQH